MFSFSIVHERSNDWIIRSPVIIDFQTYNDGCTYIFILQHITILFFMVHYTTKNKNSKITFELVPDISLFLMNVQVLNEMEIKQQTRATCPGIEIMASHKSRISRVVRILGMAESSSSLLFMLILLILLILQQNEIGSRHVSWKASSADSDTKIINYWTVPERRKESWNGPGMAQ